MSTGSNFIRISNQRADRYKKQLIVDAKTEQKIQGEIKALQKQSDELYKANLDDKISDIECDTKNKIINDKINQLIDSMYETWDDVRKRLNEK